VGYKNYIPQTSYSGVIDGQNIDFITTHEYWPGSVRVWLNGMKQWFCHDWFELLDHATIRFDEPPLSGDTLVIDYIKLALEAP